METNKLDKNIKEKLENRTFTPSASAWERLSVKLDEQPKKNKKGWFFYTSIAASILVVMAIGSQLFTTKNKELLPKNEVVILPIEKDVVEKNIDKLINEIPVEEAIVKTKPIKLEVEKKNKTAVNITKSLKSKEVMIGKQDAFTIAKVEEKSKLDVVKSPSEEIKNKEFIQNPNSVIKINADDLLFAVTHTPKEVEAYYAKHQINREDVLKTIKSELKKSNLKVNPETILAEVERAIDNDDFQNNFLKSLKKRVSDIATAIASRND